MARKVTPRVKQYLWMKWYLGGAVSVLTIIQRLWGINTEACRAEIKDVSRRLTDRYLRERRLKK